jgi:hypothetical protein
MYIGAVLLCQAYFSPLTLFPVLMPSPCLVLEVLQKLKALVLTMKLLMQRLAKQLGMMAGSIVLDRARIPKRDI